MRILPLTQLYSTMGKYESRQSDAANSWDRGIVSPIGSMGGNQAVGSDQGNLFNSLTKLSYGMLSARNVSNHD